MLQKIIYKFIKKFKKQKEYKIGIEVYELPNTHTIRITNPTISIDQRI